MIKCPDCEWSKFKDEVVAMTPCLRCNSTGYIYKPLIELGSQWDPFEEDRVFDGLQTMTKEIWFEACEESYCYLPKGHGGLHKAMARIWDSEEDKVKDEPYLPYWPYSPRWPDFNWTPDLSMGTTTTVKDADLSTPTASDITYNQNVPVTLTNTV